MVVERAVVLEYQGSGEDGILACACWVLEALRVWELQVGLLLP